LGRNLAYRGKGCRPWEGEKDAIEHCLESAYDDKAFLKGQNYITLIYDLDNSTVEAISDGNDTESGNACFSQLSEDQINSVKAIAMDMGDVPFVVETLDGLSGENVGGWV